MKKRAIVAFLLSGNATEPSWVDHDVRAYIAAMEMKVANYLKIKNQNGKARTSPRQELKLIWSDGKFLVPVS